MPPKTAAAAAAPQAPPEAPSPPPGEPLGCPDFDFWLRLHGDQASLNWKLLFCLLCVLGVLVIQDKQLQALAKAVKTLQG